MALEPGSGNQGQGYRALIGTRKDRILFTKLSSENISGNVFVSDCEWEE